MMEDQEQALRQVVSELERAWNRGDSLAWTALFAEDADLIHILGGHLRGEASIERAHRAIFDTIYKGSILRYTVEKIQPIGPEVAIVFLFAELHIATPGVPPGLQARPTLVAQRVGDTWKIVAFQNTLVTPARDDADGRDALAAGVTAALQRAQSAAAASFSPASENLER